MTKRTSKLFLGLLASATALSACGLRGGLQRPDPIFRDISPVERAVIEEEEKAETPDEGPQFNEFGGEIPETVIVDPVTESAIDDTEE
ncbi:MAG: lipoprotein [Pseudomonadota bacterium]